MTDEGVCLPNRLAKAAHLCDFARPFLPGKRLWLTQLSRLVAGSIV
jgi:hypothetical protein